MLLVIKSSLPCAKGGVFLYNENHAIVARFKRGLTDEQKENKRDKKYFEKGSFEKGAVSFAD